MKITELHIDNFGKLKQKTFRFSDKITVIYGENEAGKTTLQTFMIAMLFGMELPRGKNKAASDYGIYEPWDTASFYCGSMRFSVDGKPFFLRRNFYHKEKMAELINEADKEELSVEKGDLAMLLGGIGKSTFENTWCIRQTKALTQKELGMQIYDYLANFTESKNASVSVQAALFELNQKKKRLDKQQKDYDKSRLEAKKQLLIRKELLFEDKERLEQKREQIKRENDECIRELQREDSTKDGSTFYMQRSKDKNPKAQIISAFFLILCLFLSILTPIFYEFTLKNRKGIPLLFIENVFVAGFIISLAFFIFHRLKWNKSKKPLQNGSENETEKLSENESKNEADVHKKWQEQKTILEIRAKECERSLQELELSYRNIIEELGEFEQSTKEDIKFLQQFKSLELADQMIRSLTSGLSKDKKEELYENTVKILSDITGQTYDKIAFDENMEITLSKGQKIRSIKQLSQGTLEQVYFSIRMAVGNLLMQEEALFFTFDDAFVMYDDKRLKRVLSYLSKQEHQSFIFTCSKRELKLLEQEHIPYNTIMLSTKESDLPLHFEHSVGDIHKNGF